MYISEFHTCVHTQLEEHLVKFSTQCGDLGRNVVNVSLLSRVSHHTSPFCCCFGQPAGMECCSYVTLRMYM